MQGETEYRVVEKSGGGGDMFMDKSPSNKLFSCDEDCCKPTMLSGNERQGWQLDKALEFIPD